MDLIPGAKQSGQAAYRPAVRKMLKGIKFYEEHAKNFVVTLIFPNYVFSE